MDKRGPRELGEEANIAPSAMRSQLSQESRFAERGLGLLEPWTIAVGCADIAQSMVLKPLSSVSFIRRSVFARERILPAIKFNSEGRQFSVREGTRILLASIHKRTSGRAQGRGIDDDPTYLRHDMAYSSLVTGKQLVESVVNLLLAIVVLVR